MGSIKACQNLQWKETQASRELGYDQGLSLAKTNMFASSTEFPRYFVQYLTNPSVKKP